MKKFLLLTLTLGMSVSVFAQRLSEEEIGRVYEPTLSLNEELFVPLTDEIVSEDDGFTTLQRDAYQRKATSLSDGLFYAKPKGAMYYRVYGNNMTSTGNLSTYCVTPYFDECKYINMSTDPLQTHWSYSPFSIVDDPSIMIYDGEGNCSEVLTPGYLAVLLYLYNEDGSDYYSMAYTESRSAYRGTMQHYLCGPQYNDFIGWADNQTGSSYTTASTGYLYGNRTRTGSFTVYDAGHYLDPDYEHTLQDVTFPSGYVRNDFYAPASPLYVDSIMCTCITSASLNGGDNDISTYQPLQNGAVLSLNIYDQATGELLDTFTATTGDWTHRSNSDFYDSTMGQYYAGALTFTKKVDGVKMPFVFDRAVTIEISGFENENVDLGFEANNREECVMDDGYGDAYLYYIDPTGQYEISTRSTYSNKVLEINLNAKWDKVQIAEGYTDVTIDEDGQGCHTTSLVDTEDDFGGVQMQTSYSWYDDDGDANYSLVDVPDWITNVNVEDVTSLLTDGNTRNFYRIAFEAEENTGEERMATVYVQCKGYVDDTAITITQLGVDESDGIVSIASHENSVKTSATYNVAGQRVSDTAKGIVIKDGKKVMK